MRRRSLVTMSVAALSIAASVARGAEPDAPAGKVFRAGAAMVDISPAKLPVIINGGFLEKQADAVHDPLHARGLALDDGTTRLAIVVVDSCMLPRELIDRAKQMARERTGLPVDRMLVSATHTHSAPSAMGALGSRPDTDYVAELPGRIAETIARAIGALEPAEVGWGVVDDFEHTHCRRWIRRPDKMLVDPFGAPTARANMHPGYESPDVIGPSGPVDPALSVLAVRSRNGRRRPLAVLANYSMHYFGATPVSADYYGRFATRLARLIGEDPASTPFVAMMSQGTSGDQQWMDYARAKTSITIDAYAEAVAARAHEALQTIAYRPWVPLAMAESRLTLGRRLPDARRLEWARKIAADMGDRVPKNQPEVYAREALFLHDEPVRELKLQAIRIGELGIAAIPDEVYALTGLKIKAQSPLAPTFVIELANGSEGYIPPPEQHALGGYTTWPARTAGLEVQAEPKILAAVLGLLEDVSGRARRPLPKSHGAGGYAGSILRSSPLAYWPLDEMTGPEAADASGHGHAAAYDGGVAFYLDGFRSGRISEGPISRAVHLAGGHIEARLPDRGRAFSVELWFWNGLPSSARVINGTLITRAGPDRASSPAESLVIGGTGSGTNSGRLAFSSGRPSARTLAGKIEILPRTWHHLALVRDGESVVVYLDGRREIDGRAEALAAPGEARLLFGGALDADPSFEGKLDEVAVYDRALTAEEVAAHHRAGAEGS